MKYIPILVICFLFLFPSHVFAIDDPLTIANNKFGVHILFPQELEKAKELVNSNGGDWGYVTIPIQAKDKDLEKWQNFMDDASRLHLIPIIRIATENYYFDTKVWRKPQYEDVLDFANFLNSLRWPVKNMYVVIFNEVNRGDEWGGSPNPGEYAQLLNYASEVFKSLSPDFFIISAGLDNASANSNTSLNQYDFMVGMNSEVPGIFEKIDGLGSHSYPNPAFNMPPWIITHKSVSSFKFEKELIIELSGKNLPVFITETGWSKERRSENDISSYFAYAFEYIWSDIGVVAVTPFLLNAGTGPFLQFSLVNEDGTFNEISKTIQRIAKTAGKPSVNQSASSTLSQKSIANYKSFSQKVQYEENPLQRINTVTPFLRWILRVQD